MKYLVDTNIIIYLMNSKVPALINKFSKKNISQFCISSITVAELFYGVKKSVKVEKNTSSLLKILSPFEILDFTSLDAIEYGDIRAELEKSGKIIGGNDLLIAAQGRRQNLIVITANEKEFTRVSGLKVENWTK